MNDLTDKLWEATCTGDLIAMRSLLSVGADADEVSGPDEMPALAVAADQGHLEAVRLLLDHGVNPNGYAEFGKTALDYAVSHDYEEIARLLLRRGANVNAQCEFGTPLYFAVDAGAIRCVCLLIEHGADIRDRDYDGRTALALARANGHEDLATLLKEADVNE